MFGNIVYYDNLKINEYKTLLRGEKNLKIEKLNFSSDKGVNVGDAKASKTYEATIEESLLYDCDEFEKLLYGRDDYFDFTESDFEIETIRRGSIIKFDSYLSIPESFDLTQMIAQFKPMIFNSMSGDMSKDEQEAFKIFLETSNARIPITTECKTRLLCSKIDSKFLEISYGQLEEYELLEVTILARIISSTNVNKEKAFYDPLKDFISLNRSMRRSMEEDRPDGLKQLYVDEEYKNIEIIAMYQ